MKKKIAFTLILIAAIFGCNAQTSNDESEIKKVITEFLQGVDQQKGSMISSAFRDGAGFYATNNATKIISVTPAQLAELHEAKKFGGRDRKYKIENLNVTESIISTAKVTAYDDTVHYVYYVILSKIQEKWLIQAVMQHSKMLK